MSYKVYYSSNFIYRSMTWSANPNGSPIGATESSKSTFIYYIMSS
jgi:hypothetical protein